MLHTVRLISEMKMECFKKNHLNPWKNNAGNKRLNLPRKVG